MAVGADKVDCILYFKTSTKGFKIGACDLTARDLALFQ